MNKEFTTGIPRQSLTGELVVVVEGLESRVAALETKAGITPPANTSSTADEIKAEKLAQAQKDVADAQARIAALNAGTTTAPTAEQIKAAQNLLARVG